MKKFCCGDVVPGWSLASESSHENSHESFQPHAFRDHTLGNTQATLTEELRSHVPEANAA